VSRAETPEEESHAKTPRRKDDRKSRDGRANATFQDGFAKLSSVLYLCALA
jgi:hypothetical protein